MALPDTPGQWISDLCNGCHISQKELVKKIGIFPLSVESGRQRGNENGQQ